MCTGHRQSLVIRYGLTVEWGVYCGFVSDILDKTEESRKERSFERGRFFFVFY